MSLNFSLSLDILSLACYTVFVGKAPTHADTPVSEEKKDDIILLFFLHMSYFPYQVICDKM